MNLLIIIIELLLGVLFFILMSYLKDRNINRMDSCLLPTIMMILLAAIFTKLKDYMLLFLIFYLIADYIYLFLIIKEEYLIDKKNYFINTIITLLIGVITYQFFLLKVKYAFVDMEVFKNFIWVLIIIYFYNKINLKTIKLTKLDNDNKDSYYKEFVIVNYAKFKNKYSYLIKTNLLVEDILYSFMIYELSKKNKNVILYLKDKYNNNDKYGIMNVDSNHFITDEESIIIVKEMLEEKVKKLNRVKNNDEKIIKLIKEKYHNEEDVKSILKILNIIVEFK